MPATPVISLDSISHRYGDRLALDAVSLSVVSGEIFGLLGPNGSGKTTLFRLLATLLPFQSGTATIGGANVASEPGLVRKRIGITFQSPSLDPKLTVRENLVCQGRLYGLSGPRLAGRIDELTSQLDLSDRLADRAETLSGGLKRRVEVAKSLLHSPEVLLLDEPSTGLDPGIRHDLWRTLRDLVRSRGLTILVTTHLLDEAENCSRLAILDQGRVVAQGTPDELRRTVGGDCITISTGEPEVLANEIEAACATPVQRMDDQLRIERAGGHELVRDLMVRFGDRMRSITLGRPTLEDVFIHATGRRLTAEKPASRHTH
ncbi:MAG: ABC transporter ATP-binding protein [Planctomycetaceae bacterium]|nr:ABC transporter ATP-binding protein [Planctomycetaceae bacterium]